MPEVERAIAALERTKRSVHRLMKLLRGAVQGGPTPVDEVEEPAPSRRRPVRPERGAGRRRARAWRRARARPRTGAQRRVSVLRTLPSSSSLRAPSMASSRNVRRHVLLAVDVDEGAWHRRASWSLAGLLSRRRGGRHYEGRRPRPRRVAVPLVLAGLEDLVDPEDPMQS